jgi:uncharacterized membrane protein
MATIQHTIEVDVPVRTAYDQWTQFEEFPRFMQGVIEVEQLDDTHLRWRAKIAGKEEVWTAEIYEQRPDMRIAWRTTSGAHNDGVVTFEKIGEDKCRVMLAIATEPEGVIEKAGDTLGIVSLRVKGDLERFKKFLESRGVETGAWRGEVERQPGGNP